MHINRITKWHELVKPEKDLNLSWELITEERKEVDEALEDYILEPTEEHRAHAAKELADEIWVLVRGLYDLGYDPAVVLETVAKSNWSKLYRPARFSIELSTQKKIDEYNEKNNTKTKPLADKLFGTFKPSGKLAKGPFYKPVNYEDFESK